MLLPVVTESFVLSVTGVLDLTLKHIGKFRLRQRSIPYDSYMFKLKKTLETCQMYSKYTTCFIYLKYGCEKITFHDGASKR